MATIRSGRMTSMNNHELHSMMIRADLRLRAIEHTRPLQVDYRHGRSRPRLALILGGWLSWAGARLQGLPNPSVAGHTTSSNPRTTLA